MRREIIVLTIGLLSSLPVLANLNSMECYKIRNEYIDIENARISPNIANLEKDEKLKIAIKIDTYIRECQPDWFYYGEDKIKKISEDAKLLKSSLKELDRGKNSNDSSLNKRSVKLNKFQSIEIASISQAQEYAKDLPTIPGFVETRKSLQLLDERNYVLAEKEFQDITPCRSRVNYDDKILSEDDVKYQPICKFITKAILESGLNQISRTEMEQIKSLWEAVFYKEDSGMMQLQESAKAGRSLDRSGKVNRQKVVELTGYLDSLVKVKGNLQILMAMKEMYQPKVDNSLEQNSLDSELCDSEKSAISCYYASLLSKNSNSSVTLKRMKEACAGRVLDSCSRLPELEKLNNISIMKSKMARDRKLEQEAAEKQADLLRQEKLDQEEQLKNQKRQERLNSTECKSVNILVNYCSNMAMVETLKLLIAHEQEVGVQTGYMDSQKLRENTSAKIIIEKKSQVLSEEHKVLTGRALDKVVCKIVQLNQFKAHAEVNLASKRLAACGE